jgi:hypothetical protein
MKEEGVETNEKKTKKNKSTPKPEKLPDIT